MNNRISIVSIIVEDKNAVNEVNSLLHDFNEFIIGRMGIPYKEKNVSIISIALDAPQDKTSSLSGKLGMIKGVTSKTITSKI